MKARANFVAVLFLFAGAALAEGPMPIIDMHLHAFTADANGPPPQAMCVPMIPSLPAWDPREPWPAVVERYSREPPCSDPIWSSATDEGLVRETVEVMEAFNVFGVLSSLPDNVDDWMKAAPGRFIPSLALNISWADRLTPEQMRALFESGRFQLLGEISNQYSGIAPDDPGMDPYWALAEELDVPVAIHLGSGPPGAAYLGFPAMRIGHGSALLLEDVLMKFPGLRLSIMHYGHQRLDDTIALLENHPHVYVDLGGIQWFYSRPYFWRQLDQLIDAGFGKRIMFGSDQMTWPGLIAASIDVIEKAPSLSPQQKRDIFYNNAARFLRLSDEEIARHHGH